MALGMGSVFIFLSLLVIALQITARLVRGIEERAQAHSPGEESDLGTSGAVDPEVVAAICVAVQRFRKRRPTLR
ncbi:MAG: hypothetical protein Kow006_25470 [Gammaproteobacteria bacterium]